MSLIDTRQGHRFSTQKVIEPQNNFRKALSFAKKLAHPSGAAVTGALTALQFAGGSGKVKLAAMATGYALGQTEIGKKILGNRYVNGALSIYMGSRLLSGTVAGSGATVREGVKMARLLGFKNSVAAFATSKQLAKTVLAGQLVQAGIEQARTGHYQSLWLSSRLGQTLEQVGAPKSLAEGVRLAADVAQVAGIDRIAARNSYQVWDDIGRVKTKASEGALKVQRGLSDFEAISPLKPALALESRQQGVRLKPLSDALPDTRIMMAKNQDQIIKAAGQTAFDNALAAGKTHDEAAVAAKNAIAEKAASLGAANREERERVGALLSNMRKEIAKAASKKRRYE